MTRRSAVTVEGAQVPADCDVTVDVWMEDHRVWSFQPARDGRLDGSRRRVAWPKVLRPFLNGVADVTLREHISGRVLFDEEVRFGDAARRVRLRNKHGQPMAVSKSGVLERMFSERRDEVAAELVDGIDRLLRLLRDEGGVEAFLAFGALLGAVRDGHLIGHDTDADVAFLSRFRHPIDVTLESYELERVTRRHGFHSIRMSSGTFKVRIPTADGGVTGIDVFAGFYVDGVFHLLPGVRGDLPVTALLPVSTVTLEGRSITAPADPSALLELTYGPGWKVPDPAFHYHPPPSTKRRIGGWMRGENIHRRQWVSFAPRAARDRRMRRRSPFAGWVLKRGTLAGQVVDLGCGVGRDSLAFARSGVGVIGYDYARDQVYWARRRAEHAGLEIEFDQVNLYETRETLTTGARLAHRFSGQPVDIYARLLLTAITDPGRANFWRFARMLLPLGGRIYLEFRTPEDRGTAYAFGRHWRRYLAPEQVRAEAEAIGAVVEDLRQGRGLAKFGSEDPYVCQMVLRRR